MTNAHDLERMADYHAGDERTPLYDTTKFVYNRPEPAPDTERRLTILESDNAALKAAVARLEAIVDAIREYGEI